MRAAWYPSPVGVDRRFIGAHWLHHQGGEFITLMLEAVRISETSFFSNETMWRNIPEGSRLHARKGL
jgi:hypothetical protein